MPPVLSPVSPISPSVYPEDHLSNGSSELESSRFSAYTTDPMLSGKKGPGINKGLGISTWLHMERGGYSAPPTSKKERFDCCHQRKRRLCGKRTVLLILLISLLLLTLPLLVFTTLRLAQLGLHPALSLLIAHYGDPGSASSILTRYPTSFTRDIAPIPIHSHNDYWRRVPLFDAIGVGATSVEADIWLKPTLNGSSDLQVGHKESALTQARTLRSLYIDPLSQLLSVQNPRTNTTTTTNGIFDTSPHTPLTLLIDFKTSPSEIWPLLMAQLAPLREKGWLTHYDELSEGLVQRPITVVVTGNAQFSQVVSPISNPHRDIFFDAPLDGLDDEDPAAPYSRANTLYASVSFKEAIGKVRGWELSGEQLEMLRGQIQSARDRGLLARYWDTPAWPVRRREYVWDVLVGEGVGVLNVDNLKDATKGRW